MKRRYLLSGLGILTACLAGWVALAGAQPSSGALPPVEPVAVESSAQPAPVPIKLVNEPRNAAPAAAPAGSPAVTPPPSLVDSPAPKAPGTMPPPPSMTEPGDAGGRNTSRSAALPPTSGGPTSSMVEKPISEERPEPGMDLLSGRQEPGVSLEWVGSPVAKVGAVNDYSLVVRNLSNNPLQGVSVKVLIPSGLSVVNSSPKATADGSKLNWDLGTLVGKQECTIQLKLQAEAKGSTMPQAWVTCTGSAVMRISVREPKLTVKCSASEKVLVGDPAAFTLTVANPGDGSADHVKIHATLSEGLEHARGNKIDFDIGNLAPGESRNVTLLCATRTGGAQKCEATAQAEGGLSAKDAVSLNVIMPRLDLQLIGPHLRYLDRKAIYTLKVTNPGDAPASNVTVADMVPAGFKVLAASDGGRHDFQTRTVSWFLGEVGPGQSREVKLEVQAVNIGEHKHKATAVGARGLRAESELVTRIDGLSALLVELVDTDDPIEAGGETGYEVRITNTGSKTETDIKLVAIVPDKMEFKNATGPARFRAQGKTIVFEPLPRLAPRADAIFRISVKAAQAGQALFQIQVTSTNLTDPVVKNESTRIYSDAPETGSATPVQPTGAMPPSGAMPTPGSAAVPAPTPSSVPAPAPASNPTSVPAPAPGSAPDAVPAPEPVTPPVPGTLPPPPSEPSPN